MSTELKLVSTLLDLYQSSRSGILRVERQAFKKQLVLRKGLIACAESNLPNEHLVRIIISMGLTPRSKMNEIVSLMKTGKTSEEAVLEISQSIECIEKGRLEQAIVILASLLDLDSAGLHFYPGEDLIPCKIGLNIAVPEMLMLSARRAVSDRLIPLPPRPLRGIVSIAKSFGGEMLHFPLNASESFTLSLASESIDVASLLPLIPSGEANPEEILMRLSILGLIDLKTDPGAKTGKTPSSAGLNPIVQQMEDMLAHAETANLYETLSVKTDSSREEVQSSYHKLAKQFHPDHFQSTEFSSDICKKAERLFKFINEAYTTLSNPDARASYDEKRANIVNSPSKPRTEADPSSDQMAEALFREGRISLLKGDFEKAAELIKNSVWLTPNKAVYHRYLGIAQSEIPKLRKEAEQHLLKAVELEGPLTESHLALAKLYLEARLPRKAEIQLQQAIQCDPENPEALRLLAEFKKNEAPQKNSIWRIKGLRKN